jgi:metallophosphoesterase superfamily enzyme
MICLWDDWRLLPQRIAVHVPTGTAVLADVHLGYSAARQRLGDAIPWRTVAEEMQPLAEAGKANDIRAVLVAGDLFERGFDAAMHQQFLDLLGRLHIPFLGLVPGNHDRGIDKAILPLPTFPDGYDLAGWHILHGDQPIEHSRAVLGHWHPAIRQHRRKLPCFLTRDHQLILPAFSLDAAGVDVSKDSRWSDWDRYAVKGDMVFRLVR